MRIERQLRVAIRERQFRCAYQLKLDLTAGRVVGFEALVRWVDDGGTVHPPAAFLPVASDLGLLNDISALVLSDILAAFDRLQPSFGDRFTMSMNVAPRQASDRRFMTRLIAAIVGSGRADRFMLEITEEAVVQPEPFQFEILPLLRRQGIALSIDDFGTGCSSFSVLADITGDELKVDRSFIAAIQDRREARAS